MGKRAFDILPPYPKEEPRTYHHHEDKAKKKKPVHTFLVFVFGLFFIYILFTFAQKNSFDFSSSNTSGTKKDTTKTNFELFDNSGSSNLSSQSSIISVKLQDAASSTVNLNLIRDALLKSGFEINSTEKIATASGTIIYYKKGDLVKAQKAQDAIGSSVTAKLQESTALSTTFDLLIVIGN